MSEESIGSVKGWNAAAERLKESRGEPATVTDVGVTASELIEDLPLSAPTSIVTGPAPPSGDRFTGDERAVALRKERLAALEADPEDEEAKKVGTDEQAIPFDPGIVTVSRGEVEGIEGTNKSVTIYLVPQGHPVISFGSVDGHWAAKDVLIALGALRRGFRQYQLAIRRQTNGEG